MLSQNVEDSFTKTANFPIFKLPILFSSFIGNALEFYDFVLCGVLIPQLAPLFFPSIHPLSSLLAGMAAYAVGFVMRPLGGILFGHIGDRWGRKKALTLSMLGMAVSTFLFSLLPTYEHIGIFAGILFICLRLCQGLCLGGEVIGAALFCLEHHQTRHRGLIGGIIAAGAMGGALLASIVAYFLVSSLLNNGWRLAFMLGAFTGLVGFYIRRYLPETIEYEKSHRLEADSIPLLSSFKKHPYSFLEVFSYASIAGALSATLMVFLNSYFTKVLLLPSAISLKLASLGILASIFLHPLAGLIADKIGARKSMKFFVY